MKIIDWSSVPIGTLVRWSDSHKKNMASKSARMRLGIFTDRAYFDSHYGVWPKVFFEGENFANIVHPANVVPFRKNVKYKAKEVI